MLRRVRASSARVGTVLSDCYCWIRRGNLEAQDCPVIYMKCTHPSSRPFVPNGVTWVYWSLTSEHKRQEITTRTGRESHKHTIHFLHSHPVAIQSQIDLKMQIFLTLPPYDSITKGLLPHFTGLALKY